MKARVCENCSAPLKTEMRKPTSGQVVLVCDHCGSEYDVVVEKGDSAAPQQVDRVRLRQILTDHFNMDELRALCFDLGIDAEDLAHHQGPKSALTRDLVTYCERRLITPALIQAAYRVCPQAPWDE
ncbi:MAG: hypothetical protein KKA73_24110 [Chloroflexi bacterium]|nr:hypothetical protein [Chloroflexota bacterium]MBU1750777.1 hypothetical protein [Chloroflexota bacterium]MBU1879672.1 hypothetical protein [Chloroflexota bacterium]